MPAACGVAGRGTLMIEFLAAFAFVQTPVVVKVDHDNVEIAESCRIEIGDKPIVDADGNGVIQIVKDGVTVDFADQRLHGANTDQFPSEFTGIGIAIRAKNITLHNAKVSGYKVGIHALNADGLTIHHCDVSNNFHQRLKSTPKAEDGADWLWPHANDNNEWMTNYGAGLCVEDSNNVTIHDIRARKGQNGIILDRVNDSKVYDCDCSFLSGWGLAMWRSNRNIISRNAFDFCVRGYSHGVYNRGQDSAGILMFEQCCENIIAENSATHCGDGFFGFAGKEALGETPGAGVTPAREVEWYNRRGCNSNVFVHNDFSFAVAHGLELTFSFFNQIWNNQFIGNGICGIWAGYSQSTTIARNRFENNGEMAYGLERGGINIEHGSDNDIWQNSFATNKCGIHLWWDDDGELQRSPWANANGTESRDNLIESNSFDDNGLAIHLRNCGLTHLAANTFTGVHHEIDADATSSAKLIRAFNPTPPETRDEPPKLEPKANPGSTKPIGARKHLAGREHIIMTEWGPWDHESPLLQYVQRFDTADEYKVRGSKRMPTAEEIDVEGDAFALVRGDRIAILAKKKDTLTPYRISIETDVHKLAAAGLLTGGEWLVKTFPSTIDPRQDIDQWRNSGLAKLRRHSFDPLDLRFGSKGMAEVLEVPISMPHDHFGTIATRSLNFPAGAWRIRTLSDDGIRVKLDGKIIIEDWTHHAPREHTYEFTLEQPKEIDIEVEHFELDGYAVLTLEIEAAQ